ncbi:MAG: hypothetical protein K2X03_07195 [Bryobacteraceae bacterium]|nr:hypothetical protein [Bryobacteraceae bacterium]
MSWVSRVTVVERSKERVLVREKAPSLTGAGFLLFAFFVVIVFDFKEPLATMFMFAYFGGIGLWLLMESEMSIERRSQLLMVRRRLLFCEWSWSFPLEQVGRVEVVERYKGDGLRLVLVSGRKIGLTMSATWDREGIRQGQAALEYAVRKFTYSRRRRRKLW